MATDGAAVGGLEKRGIVSIQNRFHSPSGEWWGGPVKAAKDVWKIPHSDPLDKSPVKIGSGNHETLIGFGATSLR
ncbi:hypothetical protein GCM10009678_31610 [Actinomadura kijaniata]